MQNTILRMINKNTLFLDIAGVTGFCYIDKNDKVIHGTKTFPKYERDSIHAQVTYYAFYLYVYDVLSKNPHINKIVYEKSVMSKFTFATEARGAFLSAMQIAIIKITMDFKRIITLDSVINITLKKLFTGNGKAKKIDMVEKAKELGYKVNDHNEADAIALFTVYNNA